MKLHNDFNYFLNNRESYHDNTTSLNSALIIKEMVAREKTLNDLSTEEIRTLLSKEIALNYIVPLSLNILEKEPLISASLYKGDLIMSLLSINANFWKTNFELNHRFSEIKSEIQVLHKTISEKIMPLIKSM